VRLPALHRVLLEMLTMPVLSKASIKGTDSSAKDTAAVLHV